MAVERLEGILFSTRTNAQQRQIQDVTSLLISKDLSMGAAVDPTPAVSGLKQQLQRELGRINANFNPVQKAVSVNISGNANNGMEWQYEGFDIRSMPSRQLPAGILN
jgi:hypothetical protein